jgi:hypothetical protein
MLGSKFANESLRESGANRCGSDKRPCAKPPVEKCAQEGRNRDSNDQRRQKEMFKKQHIVSLLAGLLFILFSGYAQAATYWVSAVAADDSAACGSIDGNSDPGTYRKTVAGGAACLSGGDTLRVKAGTYAESLSATSLFPSGTPSAPTIIEGDGMGASVIRPSSGRPVIFSAGTARQYITFRKLGFDAVNSGGIAFLGDGSNGNHNFITIEDSEIKNSNSGAALNITGGSHGWIIRRNKIHDNLASNSALIYARGNDMLFERNEIYNSLGACLLFQFNDAASTGNIARWNLIYNCAELTDGNGNFNDNAGGSLFYQNIVINGSGWGITATRDHTPSTPRRHYNNTIFNNGAGAVNYKDPTTSIQLKENIVVGTISSDTANVVTPNTTTNPGFKDTSAGNYNVPLSMASNGTDYSSLGILHNNQPGRGALDPMEFASAHTRDSNTVRIVLHNSFGALKNVATFSAWSCRFNGGAATNPTGVTAASDTEVDLDLAVTMDENMIVDCSYNNDLGNVLNSINIGNRTNNTGNAHLLSFTNQAVTNTLGGGGGGSPDAPVVASVGYSEETSDTASHDALIPVGTGANDLLLFHSTLSGTPTITGGMTGWTQLSRTSSSTDITGEIWWKIATGSESNFVYTTSASEQSTTRIFRITGWHGTSAPEVTGVSGNSAMPDCPSLSVSWGSESNRWLCVFSRNRGDALVTAYPANYDDDQFNDSTGTGSGTVQSAAASRGLNAETQDPGAYSSDDVHRWAAFTIAVRPGTAGGGGGSVPAVFEQRDYCWKDWQDAETTACKVAQNVPAHVHGNAKIVARIGIGITADDPPAQALSAQYRVTGVNAIDWTSITDSCAAPCVKYTAPKTRSNGEATTRLLTLPGGLTFAAGILQAQQGSTPTADYAENTWVEFDQSIELVGLSAGDTVEVRMKRETELLETYTMIATLNVEGLTASAP